MINKYFATGFVIGLILFLVINLLAAHLASDCGLATFSPTSACADGIARLGWPLQFYESGGFMYTQSFNALYLAIDIGLGLLLASLAGWILFRRKEILPN
jgi:hypothetical protein